MVMISGLERIRMRMMIEYLYRVAVIGFLLTGSILIFVGWALYHNEIKDGIKAMLKAFVMGIDRVFYWILDRLFGNKGNP